MNSSLQNTVSDAAAKLICVILKVPDGRSD